MRPDAIASALLAILLPFVGGRVDSSGDSRLSGAAAAADPPAAPPQELYRVVIPVDEKQRPVGDYVYVSRGLYDGLLQQSLQSQRFPDQLLRSANYTLQFAWNKEAKRLELEEVAAQWELETKRDEMSVRIPIRRDQLHLLPERARLDGQPIKVDWSAVGDALLAPVEKRGVYRLELAWTASPKLRDDWMELTLAIPAVARSQLKTRLAPDAPPITYPSALGAISALPAEDAVVELGPTNQLALRWPTEARRSRSVVNLEAEQFLWWKVRPGSVVVEGRFLFRPVQGALTEAQLTVDPRWRLLPLAPAPEIERVWTEDGALTTLHFLLREPTSKPLEIRADFQLPQAAGIGQLVAPTLAAAANRLTTNWSAVSVPNDYEMDTSREPESLPLAPEEFLRRWGAAPQIPAAAFDLSTAAAAPLTFSVRPRNFQAVCDQTADYSFRRDSISLHYQAELSASPPHQFHRQARIPTGFRVSRVTLTAEGAPVKLRWLQAADDVLRIDLFQPPPPRQLLEIEAESTSGLLGKCTLPDIHLSDVATRTSRLRIYRAADAQVQLLNLEGFSESPPAGADEQPSRGRLTNVLLSAAAKGKTPAAVTLEHSSNQPDARVRLITLIREEHPTWFAEVECRLQVQGGVLDAFRLEIPAEWVGPLEVFPTMEQRLIVIPGQSRRHLLLTPPQPWAGEARVVIRGPLRTSGGGAFRVPDVVPLDFTIADRLIVVPRQSGERALAWETAGLQNTAIPPSPLTTPLPRDSFEAFQVVAPHFEAALASTSSAVGVLKLNQAQALIHWKGDSSYWGTADFSIEPSGQDELTIQMPEGSELVQASLAGIPAAAVRLGEYSWKISLAPEAYPQLLRLCFVGRCPAATAQARDCIWQLPRIVGLPAQRILWTVAAPPEVAGRFGATQAARLSPLEFSSGEMQAVINSVQVAAAGGALNRRPDQAEAWLSFWARRFAVCRRNAYGRIGDGSSPALPPEREIKLREEEFGAATANLTPDVPLDLESLARSAAEPGPPIVGQVVPTYWQSRTLDNSLTLSLAALPRPTEIPQWLLAILVFGGLLLAGYFALGNHHVEQWAAAYPGFACFLGIAAICCLTPATWLGWIAAVTVLIAALSRPWPARNLEPVSTRTLGLQNGLQKT